MNTYLLKKDDIDRIKSKSLYWEEIYDSSRGNSQEILRNELSLEIRKLGFEKMLLILSYYANQNTTHVNGF